MRLRPRPLLLRASTRCSAVACEISPIKNRRRLQRLRAEACPAHDARGYRFAGFNRTEYVLEFRRTLFREGFDAFLDFGTAHAVAMPQIRSRFIKLAARELINGPFHASHRNRCVAGQDGGEAIDFLVQSL